MLTWPRFSAHRSISVAISALLLLAANNAAIAEPKSSSALAVDALHGHLRSDNREATERAIREGLDRIRAGAARSPRQRIAATIFFKDGVSSERLAQIARENNLDLTYTDAKVAIGDAGEAYTVLTRHAPVPAEQLSGKLRVSDRDVMPAIAAATAGARRASARNHVQLTDDLPAPELRYFSASVIGSQSNLASVASRSEVLTLTVDIDLPETVDKLQATRRESTLDPFRSARIREYLSSRRPTPTSSSTRSAPATTDSRLELNTVASTTSEGGSPPPPAWFGAFQENVVTDADPDANKIDMFPIDYYYQCLGHDCPNNWTWLPRQNRQWQLGIVRHFGGCYLVPSFYYNWTPDDDTVGGVEVTFVEVCEQPWTEGSSWSQFKFSNRQKDTPTGTQTELALAAYHAAYLTPCLVGPTGSGTDIVEWPCLASDVNAVYINNSTIEDESHIANPACTIATTRNPFNRYNWGCFNIYRIVTNLPAAYDDDSTFDPGSEFQSTVGSANAAAFNSYTTYWSYIWFASTGLNYLAGTEARHELEIGTAFPGQWCAPYCVFKTKEATIGTLVFFPVKPAGLSISNLTNVSAKANWTNPNDVAGISGFEWRLNGGSWNAAAASPANLNGLSPNTSYAFEVRAIDTAGTRGPSEFSSFTTPGPISITGSNGAILPSAASLYNVSNNCQSGQWHTACTWMVRKSYGDFSAVAVVVRAPDGSPTTPACTNGTTQQLSSGYVRSGCSLSVESTLYGN